MIDTFDTIETESGVDTLVTTSGFLLTKFAENQFAILIVPHCYTDEPKIVGGQFLGDVETDEFYETEEEAFAAIKSGKIGGPDGELDLDKTQGRHYEVLGFFYNKF